MARWDVNKSNNKKLRGEPLPSKAKKKTTAITRASRTNETRRERRHWEPSERTIDTVAEALGRRARKHDIYRIIQEEAGRDLGEKTRGRYWYDLHPARCEEVLTLGRKALMDKCGLEPAEAKGLSITLYESIIRDPSSTPNERLRAQERIDDILGLSARFGQGTESADALAAKIRDVLGAIRMQMEPGGLPGPPTREVVADAEAEEVPDGGADDLEDDDDDES